MNWKKMLAVVLSTLGVQQFEKDAEGKDVLSEEQSDKIKGIFGEAFLSTLKKNLSAEESVAQDAEILTTLKEHFDANTDSITADLKTQITALENKNKTLQDTITTLAGQPEEAPKPQAAIAGVGSGNTFRVNMSAPYNVAAVAALQSGQLSAAGSTIDVDPLRTEFGTYLSQGNSMEILRQIYNGFDTGQHMTPKIAITEWRATRAIITSIVQQFSPKWTPAGKSKFTPIAIQNRRHKINVPIVPAEVLDSWLLHLYDERQTVDQMPITKYIIENLIKPAILNDVEMRMIAKGKYKEKAWGDVNEGDAATPPEDGMDGFETILVAAKALANTADDKGVNFFDGQINLLNCSEEEILTFFEGFVDWVSPMYQTLGMNIFTSKEVYIRYKRAYKNKWGAGSGTEKVDFGEDVVDFSSFRLVALQSMFRSPIVFSTPKQNFIMLQNRNTPQSLINDVQKSGYEVRLFGEFWLATGFAIGEAVFAHVPDGYNPKDAITSAWGASTDYQKWNSPSGSAALPVITTQPESHSYEASDSFTLEVVAENATTYQWLKNGQPIPGAKSAELEIDSAEESDEGDYQVMVSNSAGFVLSDVVELTFESL